MNLRFLDKLGAIGAFLAAAACPLCFPLLAVIGSAVGLGVFLPYEGITVYVLQAFVLVALIGNTVSYLNHKKVVTLIIAVASTALIFFAFYVNFKQFIVYIGLLGLVITAVLNYVENKKCRICEVTYHKTTINNNMP